MKEKVLEVLSIITELLTGIMAVIGLIWSVFEHKKMLKREESRMMTEQSMLWYNEAVLRGFVEQLNKTIDEANVVINKIKSHNISDTELKEQSKTINEQLKLLLERVYILDVFPHQVSRNIRNDVELIMDCFSDIINKTMDKQFGFYQENKKMHTLQTKIVKKLYELGTELSREFPD